MKRTKLHHALSLLVLTGLGGAWGGPELAAQPAIAVTGHAGTRQQVDVQTRAISRQHDRQLARFEDAVCISVSGLEGPYNEVAVRRIASDARDAGLHVDKAGCHPNIVIVIAKDARKELERLSHDDGAARSLGMEVKDLVRLADTPGPAYVATITAMRGKDGAQPHVGTLTRKDETELIGHDVSIIDQPARYDITAVLMVLESSATLGKTLQQIADYAAFRTLSDLNGDATETIVPSILTLFRDKAPAQGLTDYDRAYLAGLYRGSSAMTANARVEEITSAFMRGAGK
ncbi:hypothetical protein [Novosphingobium terrae]|uniref:hypothetical protein n=1 Tax=Novosphingobium terrae TaxID=2726189 RepID=UPI0019815718|nr:hypothetical protein [Novosphingobium terrae]